MTERVSKRARTLYDDDIFIGPTNEEFVQCIKDSFSAFFKNNDTISFSTQLSNQQNMAFQMAIAKKEKEAIRFIHYVLGDMIRQYRKYIGVPPRFVPFFRPLYWVHYRELRLCTRVYGIPPHVVWMILERLYLTKPIKEDGLHKATMACIRSCNYLNRFYLEDRRKEDPNDATALWGEDLAKKLLKNEVFQLL